MVRKGERAIWKGVDHDNTMKYFFLIFNVIHPRVIHNILKAVFVLSCLITFSVSILLF